MPRRYSQELRGRVISTVAEGFVDQVAAVQGVGAEEGVRRWLETRIEATVTAKALRPGTGVLHVALIPDDVDERAVTWSIDAEVSQ